MVNVVHPAFAKPAEDQQATEVFRRQWQIYQRMVDEDYFAHRKVYKILHRVLTKEVKHPFRFLDLACGDAGGIVAALQQTTISGYHGIDLSPAALELASKNLAALPCPVELEERDFIETVRNRPPLADVVWIGLSLHHLNAPSKRDFMAMVRNLVGETGLFLIYEPTFREGETRELYMERAEWSIRSFKIALSTEEMDEVVRHVRTCDFPERATTWKEMARGAGFNHAEQLFVGPDDLFAFFSFGP